MSKPQQPHHILNLAFLEDRISELGLKQWWVAEQIGVDRKSLSRWLSGQVRSAKTENIEALARVLSCQVQDLTVADETLLFASPADQKQTAQLILDENLLNTLAPMGQWPMLEAIVKNALGPELPLPTLGKLMNWLSIACWRQSQMSRAEQYAKRALEIGSQIHHRTVIVGAQLNLAILASYRGELDASLALYREVLSTSQFLEEPRLRASARSNFAQDLLLMGDIDSSRENQAKAIVEFEKLNLPFNLGIAHCGMGFVELASEKFAAATSEFEIAVRYATAAQDKRGQCAYLIYKADAWARAGRLSDADELYAQSRSTFDRLGLEEALTDEVGARIARLNGRFDDAEALLLKGFEKARPYPLETASLWVERARLRADFQARIPVEVQKRVPTSENHCARSSLQQAAAIYEKAGAKIRWQKLTQQISECLEKD